MSDLFGHALQEYLVQAANELPRLLREPVEGAVPQLPRQPIVLPVNLFRMLLPLVATVAILGVGVWALTRWLR